MSDLTEILKMQWEAYPNALKTGQEAQASAIGLENARRAQQEREGLKALYAKQAPPSYQQIGAFDPAMAQEYLKNQFVMQKDMVGMQHQQAETAKILNAEDREKETSMANAALPFLNAYEANKGKIPDAENLYNLRTALSKISTQAVAEGWAPSHHTSMDPNATYESIVSNANKSKVYTDSQRLNQEAAKAQGSQQGLVQGGVAPQPSTYYNSFGHDENGNAFVIPGSSGMWPPGAKSPENTQPPDANATPADPANIKKLAFYEGMLKDPDATAEDQAFAEAQIRKLSPKENFKVQPQVVINTPEQMDVKKAKLKGEIAGAEKAAALTAEEKAADRKAIETYFRGPKPEAIRKLINESIEGDVQSGLARLGKFFGVAVPGGDALAALKVIQQQMARSLPYAPGASSDIDVRNRLEMISNPATDEPIVNRLRALEEVIRDAEAYVVQKGDFLSEDQILDSIENGYLSETNALEMINNRLLNKGKPIYAPTQGNKTSTGVK
jgi:hypothetical protein